MDPRIFLFYWISITALVFKCQSLVHMTVIIAVNILVWFVFGDIRKMWGFIKLVLPLLIFVMVINPTNLVVAIRLFAILSPTAFVMSMGNDRLVLALRNLRSQKLTFFDVPIGLSVQLVSQGLLATIAVKDSLLGLQELQKIRGTEPAPRNLILRTKRMSKLTIPLLLRMLERNRQVGITQELLGYDPFTSKTVYVQLHMSTTDWLAVCTISALFIIAFTVV